jgi:hypothetical protein
VDVAGCSVVGGNLSDVALEKDFRRRRDTRRVAMSKKSESYNQRIKTANGFFLNGASFPFVVFYKFNRCKKAKIS